MNTNELKEKATKACETAKAKIMETWASGSKGKGIVIGAGAAIFLLFVICIASCGGSDEKGSSSSSGGFSFAGYGNDSGDFKKLVDSDALFFEGEWPTDMSQYQQEEDLTYNNQYKKVVPNFMRLPKYISNKELCGSLNPELAEYREKGVAYLNNPDDAYYCEVVHIEDDHVIVRPNSTSMWGEFYGYIETDDEYVEGADLKLGFYTYLGHTKKVSLVTGSSITMYAFRKLDDKTSKKVFEAIEYNQKAIDAAEAENGKRADAAYFEGQKKQAQEEEAKLADACKKVDEAFLKEFKKVNPKAGERCVHIAPQLKGKVSVEIYPVWDYGTADGRSKELGFEEMKSLVEKIGGSGFMFGETKGNILVLPEDMLKSDIERRAKPRWRYKIECSDPSCCYGAYYVAENPDTEEMEGTRVKDSEGRGIPVRFTRAGSFYVIDLKADKELADAFGKSNQCWGDDARSFAGAFLNKYEK